MKTIATTKFAMLRSKSGGGDGGGVGGLGVGGWEEIHANDNSACWKTT
jgi:hypothetical protein